jgi:hypothetical protein
MGEAEPGRQKGSPVTKPLRERRGTRGRGRVRAAAGPRDQFGFEDEPAVLVLVGPVGLVQQELGGGPAELVLGLAHRGERDRGVGSELDVVVADNGYRGRKDPRSWI